MSFEGVFVVFDIEKAEWTGLEPATPCVTGMYSNQLNYHSVRAANIVSIFYSTRFFLNFL